jgi:hypothetical protein
LATKDRVYDGRNVNALLFVATNDDLSNDMLWDKRLRPHHAALFNRSAPVCIPGHSRPDLWEWSVHVGLTSRLLNDRHGGGGISMTARNAALEFFTTNLWQLKVVSPRTLHTIAQTFHDFRDDGTLPHHLNLLLDPSLPPGTPIPHVPAVLVL